jgi:AcrR family transcriptional regulator
MTPTPPLRADAARNRAKVIDVARVQLAGDLTRELLPMNAIAKSAGVGVGTVYRHFPTQQSLLEAVAEKSFAALLAAARAAVNHPDPDRAFEDLLRTALELMLDDVGLAAVLAAGEFECDWMIALGTEFFGCVAQVLARARSAGVIRPELTPDDLRRLLGGLGYALRTGTDPRSRLSSYLAVLLAGLRP